MALFLFPPILALPQPSSGTVERNATVPANSIYYLNPVVPRCSDNATMPANSIYYLNPVVAQCSDNATMPANSIYYLNPVVARWRGTELCRRTRTILLAPQAMTATKAMVNSDTCVFDRGDLRRRHLCSPISHPAEPALSCEFAGTVPFLSTVPLLYPNPACPRIPRPQVAAY